MAKPSKKQLEQLDKLRLIVVEIMKDMVIWENFDLELINEDPECETNSWLVKLKSISE